MKYITEVALKNFQSHKNTVLKFDNKLNIIVGPSDSGKTSVLRGIKWVLYNEPLGDYFMRDGEDSCSVTISLNNGVRVERYRDKSKNQYNIYNGEEKETYEGFGSGVPLEVSQAIGIDKLELDQKESRSINLAEQLEGPFLISEKPSVKASSIGRLVGANIIDDALKESLKDNRNLNIKLNALSADNQTLEEELKSYDYLEKLSRSIEKLDLIYIKIEEKQKLRARLEDLEKANRENVDLKNKNLETLDKLKSIEKLESEMKDLELKIYRTSNLQNLQVKTLENIEGKKLQEDILSKCKNLDTSLEKTGAVENLIDRVKFLSLKDVQLKNLASEKKKSVEIVSKFKNIEKINSELLNKQIDKYRQLCMLEKLYKDNKTSLSNGEVYIEKFVKLDGVSKGLDKLESKKMLTEKLINLRQAYLSNTESRKLGSKYLKERELEIDKILKEYGALLEKAETCPLCLSKISHEHVQGVMSKFLEENYEL